MCTISDSIASSDRFLIGKFRDAALQNSLFTFG